MQVAKLVYESTEAFPERERYGLTIQMRKASISIPSNIAEGCGKASEKEFARFLQISLGSAYELETQILLSKEFDFIALEEVNVLVNKLHVIQRQTAALIKKLS
jgi:four helix bundle protein